MAEGDHVGKNHEFSIDGKLVKSEPQSADTGERTIHLPSDPILRVALLNKGILTPQDIADAQAIIDASGVYVADS